MTENNAKNKNAEESAFPIQRVVSGKGEDYWETPERPGLTKREYFAAMANVDLDGFLVTTVETIMGKPIPDFKLDPMANVKYMAEFKAILKLAEADALLNKLNSKCIKPKTYRSLKQELN